MERLSLGNIQGVTYQDDKSFYVGNDKFVLKEGSIVINDINDMKEINNKCICEKKIYCDTLSYIKHQQMSRLYGNTIFKDFDMKNERQFEIFILHSLANQVHRFNKKGLVCDCEKDNKKEEIHDAKEDNKNNENHEVINERIIVDSGIDISFVGNKMPTNILKEKENTIMIKEPTVNDDYVDAIRKLLNGSDYFINNRVGIFTDENIGESLKNFFDYKPEDKTGIYFDSKPLSLLILNNIPFVYLSRCDDGPLSCVRYTSSNMWNAYCYRIDLRYPLWSKKVVNSVILDHISPLLVYGYGNSKQANFLLDLINNGYSVKMANDRKGDRYDVGLYDGDYVCDRGNSYLNINNGKMSDTRIVDFNNNVDILAVVKGTIIRGYFINNCESLYGPVYIADSTISFNFCSPESGIRKYLLVYDVVNPSIRKSFSDRKFKALVNNLVGSNSAVIYKEIMNVIVRARQIASNDVSVGYVYDVGKLSEKPSSYSNGNRQKNNLGPKRKKYYRKKKNNGNLSSSSNDSVFNSNNKKFHRNYRTAKTISNSKLKTSTGIVRKKK